MMVQAGPLRRARIAVTLELGPRSRGRAEAPAEAERVETLGSAQVKVIVLLRRAVELDSRLEPEATSRKVATDSSLSRESKAPLALRAAQQSSLPLSLLTQRRSNGVAASEDVNQTPEVEL